jgi:alpha-1,2-mannosyltransferase
MPRPFSVIARGPTRRRLWVGSGCVGLFIVTLAVFYAMLPKTPHREGISGMDFIAFYTAGTFVREGRSRDLYNLHTIGGFQHELAHQQGDDLGQAIGPWWNPPYYAWLFVPFARLPYTVALTRWIICNVLCAAVAATILALWVRRAAAPGRATDAPWTSRASAWGLVPVLLVLSTPFIHALSHAQNTCTSLLLLTFVVAAWRREMPLLAGLLLGLLAYKPQLAALMAAIMTICLGWRVLVGLAITGAALLGVTVLQCRARWEILGSDFH